jgi:hypothetical protein
MRPLTLALIGLAINLALLLPGLFLPVMTVTGQLEPEGIAEIAPSLLEKGISDDTVKSFKLLMNPLIVRGIGNDENLKKEMLKKLSPQIIASLKTSATQVEVYRQERSILGSVQHLYEVGSFMAATLILLFSVLVPFGKLILVLWASIQPSAERRQRAYGWLAAVTKWSMADVFAVALLITFLAAQASQAPAAEGQKPNLLVFDAFFGPGFYWFASYCLVSIVTHQLALKWDAKLKAAA